MSEQQLQFRVGLFVVTAAAAAIGLTIRFGDMRWLWEKHYTIQVHFPEAPGAMRGTPVRINGVTVGSVHKIAFDQQAGGVAVEIRIQQQYPLRSDTRAQLVRSFLGDASIEFTPGRSPDFVKPGAQLEGLAARDLAETVASVERQVATTLEAFTDTTREWQQVATNVNALMDTHRGNLDMVVERAAESLHQFTLTMRNANKLLADPETEHNLKTTLAALPAMVQDTQRTILVIRSAVSKMDDSLGNLKAVTDPLAQRSQSIVVKLDKSVGHLESLLAELNQFAKLATQEQGSLRMLATDPQLYLNLNQSAAVLQTLLKNLDPVVRDMRVFSDKVARHPELIGVGGAFKGSSGIK